MTPHRKSKEGNKWRARGKVKENGEKRPPGAEHRSDILCSLGQIFMC